MVKRTTKGNVQLPETYKTKEDAIAAGMILIDSGAGTSFGIEETKETWDDEAPGMTTVWPQALAHKFWVDKQGYWNLKMQFRRTNPLKRAFRTEKAKRRANNYKPSMQRGNMLALRRRLNGTAE